jgi:hypothetical protein
MKLNVQVVIESEDGQSLVEDVASITRSALSTETLRLSLAETKKRFHNLQKSVLNQKIDEYLQAQRGCPQCGRHRSLKGPLTLIIRTVFGKLTYPAPGCVAARAKKVPRTARARWQRCCRNARLRSWPI